ncbi:MAG: hypothetical protein IKV59_10455 [Lachnospiraceae bacterium]|nr:hypothetical protein [Lachnospiraceae bacterium]
MKKKIRELLRDIYIGFRVQLRVIRLSLMHVPEPEDAKTASQMAKEIREAAKSSQST